MRKLTAILVASTLALGTAGIAHANDASTTHSDAKIVKEGKAPRGMHHEMMLKNLNLTTVQKQQVKEIMKAAHDNMRKQMLDERRGMHSLVTSDTFDADEARVQMDKAEAARKANMLSRLETQNKIYNILTPEQKKQYNDDFEKRLTQAPGAESRPMPAE